MNLPIKTPKFLTKVAGKIFKVAKKTSPEVCVIGGIVLGVGAVVVTGIKTWKGKDILVADCDAIRAVTHEEVTNEDSSTSLVKKTALTQEEKKQLWVRRYDFGKDIVKIYWLPVTLGASAICFVWGGRTMLRKELSAMTAIAASLSESYKKLYNNVRNELGDEKAQELAYGVKMIEGVDDKGEKVKMPIVDRKSNTSPYAVMFDPGEWDETTGEWIWKNYEWKSSKLLNIAKIRNAQNTYNDILHLRGWVLWGEVAKYLGLKPDANWYRVGWKDDGTGNKFIELGVLEGAYQIPFNRKFTDEHDSQNICIIDPNVDGCIDFVFDDIEKYDHRCGRRGKKNKNLPSEAKMFGNDYATKLLDSRR